MDTGMQLTATRLTFKWWGERRQVERSTRQTMAEAVDADCNSISASKRLYNPKLEPISKINSLKTSIIDYWRNSTLPYVENGVRLIKNKDVEEFTATMTGFQQDLISLADDVQYHRAAILLDAQQRLGKSFSDRNYPLDLSQLFAVEWSFPSIEPPKHLQHFAPSIYKIEQERAQAKLAEAVHLAEQAFLTELQDLVSHLHEKLTPDPAGVKKVFRDSAVTNLADFFDKFKKLNLGSNKEVDAIVEQAQSLTMGLTAKELRTGEMLRKDIATDLAALKDKINPMIAAAPRRKLIRPKDQLPCQETNAASQGFPATIPLPKANSASHAVPSAMAQ